MGLVFVSSTVISHIVSVKGHSARTLYGLAVQQIVTVQLAPFVKAHYVLTVADATVLLINRRTSVWLNCRQKIIKNDLLNSCQCDKIEISEI